MGFVEETGIARHYRDARIITIYEGTTGIQANDLIGRKILRENGATLRELIAEMRGVAGDLNGGGLADLGARLTEDVAALERAVDWVLANGKAQLGAVMLGAVPFLHLFGGVCASWQLGRTALAARAQLGAGRYGDDYLHGLVELAHFYAHALAVQAPALSAAVTGAGGGATRRALLAS